MGGLGTRLGALRLPHKQSSGGSVLSMYTRIIRTCYRFRVRAITRVGVVGGRVVRGTCRHYNRRLTQVLMRGHCPGILPAGSLQKSLN